ncbi:DUF1778 domain-containing protein [Pasteurella oralis]|uniref:type II toxin-antitoxin system TacA family antitoxin n=1 Tax=Pasteurella oralis TaxID=1071947 RepID=UPI001FEA58F7|nr:DUF1778 domain-containing protein [Pasteurella oralis]
MAATARFEARISPEVHVLLKHAAAIEGRSLTDFVVNAALSAARHTVEKNKMIHLTMSDQQQFANALIDPPLPNEKMKKAMHLSKDLLGE